jgi:hypothetical protein
MMEKKENRRRIEMRREKGTYSVYRRNENTSSVTQTVLSSLLSHYITFSTYFRCTHGGGIFKHTIALPSGTLHKA